MANVYLAEDQELGRAVAIKMLDDRHAQDEQFVERFRREAKNAAGLSHPNIVSIYDRGQAEGTYYIAMEYLEGRTLKELLVARGPTPIPVAIDYARQILAALGFAHRHGVVHRDIKPHNVVVAPDGRLKVMDFGIARAGTSQMTETGSIIGTAQYLSPEQAKGAPVDAGLGHLLGRDRPLRDADRLGPVHRRHAARDRDEAPLGDPGAALGAAPRGAARARLDRPARAGEAPRGPLPDRRGDGRRPRPRGARPGGRAGDRGGGDARAERRRRGDRDLGRAHRGRPPTARLARSPRAYGPPTGFYEYDEPIRRRSFWPWLLAALLVAAAIVGRLVRLHEDPGPAGRDEAGRRAASSRASKEATRGRRRSATPACSRTSSAAPNDKVPETDVVSTGSRPPGTRTDKGNPVTIVVSTGLPKVDVPGGGRRPGDRRGRGDHGARPEGRRPPHQLGQGDRAPSPARIRSAGTRRASRATKVRINVSRGPEADRGAAGRRRARTSRRPRQLQGAGFAVARRDVDSNDPKGTVVQEDPPANSLAAKGSTVTLYVSKGPTESVGPRRDELLARRRDRDAAQLRLQGGRGRRATSRTRRWTASSCPRRRGPATSAKPGTTVTITVGHYAPPADDDDRHHHDRPRRRPTRRTTDTTTLDTTPVP